MNREKNFADFKDHEINHENEEFVQFLTFDSLRVKLMSSSTDAINFCTDYFQCYAEIDDKNIKKYDWKILDTVDESIQNSFCTVNREEKEITLLRSNSDFKFVMRTVRSLVMLEDISHGKMVFKGASFINKKENGVVLMGERLAGKTSVILSYMLRNDSQARFVTNSQVALNVENGSLFAYGYPMSMGIRIDVLEAMQKEGNRNIIPLLHDLKNNMKPGEEGRYYLDPNCLRKYFQNRIARKASINAIIFIKNVPIGFGSTIKYLLPEDVEIFFKEYYVRHSNWGSNGWENLFMTDINKQEDSIRDILKNRNLYELTYNIDNQNEAMEFLDTL